MEIESRSFMNQEENQKGSVQTSANNPQMQMLQQMQTQIPPQSNSVDEIPMKEPKQKNHNQLFLVIVFLIVIAILCICLFLLFQENKTLKDDQEPTTSENQPSSTPSTTIVSPSTSVTPSAPKGYTGKVVCTKYETVDTGLGYVTHTGTFEDGVISYLEIQIYLQYGEDIPLQDRQAIVEDPNIVGEILRQQFGFSNFTVDATLDGYTMTIQGSLDQIDPGLLTSNAIYPNMTNGAFLNSRTTYGFTCNSEI